jgi:hypothetical protein
LQALLKFLRRFFTKRKACHALVKKCNLARNPVKASKYNGHDTLINLQHLPP